MNIVAWPVLGFTATWTLIGATLLAVTALLTRKIQNAAARHLAWTAAFGCILLWPFYEIPLALHARETNAQCVVTKPQGSANSGPGASPTLGWLLAATWCSGTAWVLGRALWARIALNKWRRESHVYRPSFQLPIDHVPARAEVRLARGDTAAIPITWGALRPVILLPQSAAEWDAERLAAVLGHEAGHIRRFDNLTQIFALIACAIHWYNPLFWRAAKVMEAEAEIAADDFAILRGVKPSRYAKELLDLAEEHSPRLRSDPFAFAQTAMLKVSTLEERLVAIIDPTTRRGPICFSCGTGIASVLCSTMVAITLLVPHLGTTLIAESVAKPACFPNPTEMKSI